MNMIYLALTYYLILALSMCKSCLGQTIDVKGLQAKNGTIAEITWTITLSEDQIFSVFTAFTAKDTATIINLVGTTLTSNPQSLDGKMKNVTYTVNPDVITVKMLYGPVDQIKDNGLKIGYQVFTNKGSPGIKAVQLEVTTSDPTTEPPTTPPTPPTGKPTPNVGTIVGAIIGGILGVVIIGIIVYFVIRWKTSLIDKRSIYATAAEREASLLATS